MKEISPLSHVKLVFIEKKKQPSSSKKHNHTSKTNPEINWTLFKVGVWEDYLFSFQCLLGKNAHGLLLTEYYHGQRQKSKVLKGRCYG